MRCLLLPILLIATSCSIGSGSGAGDGSGLGAAAGASAPWLIVDLASGRFTPATTVAHLTTSPAYRDALVVFRRVDLGSVRLGQAVGSPGHQADEATSTATAAPFYIAAFELTRAQWRRLAGTQPWTTQLPVPSGSSDDLPATGMSFDQVRSTLAAWNAGHATLVALPSAQQWEAAARAGSAAVFPWGDDPDPRLAAAYACTWDTGAPTGPNAVNTLQPNALGLYHVCGNVWEFTDDGAIRGGSWGDALALARPANQAEIEPGTGHETVGLRLVYRP
jgi:formylglycine-generating enzyme required for sulfatase activity